MEKAVINLLILKGTDQVYRKWVSGLKKSNYIVVAVVKTF